MNHVHGRLPSQTAAHLSQWGSTRAAVLCATIFSVAAFIVAAGCSSDQSTSADPYSTAGTSSFSSSSPRSCIGPAYSADAAYSTIGGFHDPRVIPSDQIIAAQQAQIARMQSQSYAAVRAQMLQQSQSIDSTEGGTSSADYAAYLAWKRAQGYQ